MRPDRYCPLSALPYFDLCLNPVSDLVLDSGSDPVLGSDLGLESGLDPALGSVLGSGLGPALESALDLGLGPVLESALDPGLDLVSGLVSDRYPFPV